VNSREKRNCLTVQPGILCHRGAFPIRKANLLMPGQHIWHIKVRRIGQADYEIAEVRLDQRHAPVQSEIIDVVVIRGSVRESIRAKSVSFHTSQSGSTATYTIRADEQDSGTQPGYRETTAKDFEQ
jgi:hypothetical protein